MKNVDFGGTSSLHVNNMINAAVYQQSGVEFNSVYAKKNSTDDQLLSGNTIIGTGQQLSKPAIILNGIDWANTLNSVQTKADMATYITSASLVNYVTSGSLMTYAPLTNPTCTGALSTPAITLNGTDLATLYQPRFIVAGFVQLNGTFGASYGRIGCTSSRTGNGAYVITFSSNIGLTSYAVAGGLRNAAGYITYNGTGANGVNIQTYNTSGVQTDNQFIFYVLT